MRSGLRPGRTYERQRCRVGAARLRCRAGTASPPSSSSSSAPSKPAKTGKSRLGAVLPVRPLTLKDVFLSTEMRRVPAVNSANSAQQALTLLGSAVSLATPLSALSYPYMINLVADLLHDNPPNTQVLSYYLSTVGLLFGFAVSTTYYFLYAQQTDLYNSIYAEASALNTLLEECACALRPRDAATAAAEVRRYLTDGVWAHEPNVEPAEALASEILHSEDAINRLAKHVFSCVPLATGLDLAQSVRCVREAGSRRIAAGQSKVPELQLAIVRLLAALVLLIFPLTHATSVAGDALEVGFEAILFGNLCGVVSVTSAIIDDLHEPHSGLFTVMPVRDTLQDALLQKCDIMLASCDDELGCETSAVRQAWDEPPGVVSYS